MLLTKSGSSGGVAMKKERETSLPDTCHATLVKYLVCHFGVHLRVLLELDDTMLALSITVL